ncbi:serine hydrolase [Gorillibacterium sp. CAU 1737]|uniref:serine hydrolase domain-containing protein n=1 Tax=Gorillibacterium sp. CAU 1737 TaxID=3140362 RepID=UPI00325FE2A0
MNELGKRFAERIQQDRLNVLSLRVLQRGQLIGSWDRSKDERRLQHSVSKSFTSMAVGLALEEGKLALTDRLKDIFPEYAAQVPAGGCGYPPGDLRLSDLLRMTSGHDSPPFWAEERAALHDKDWVQHYLSLPLDRPPGERFTYSSGDTFILSAVVQKAVGVTVADYLTPRLFDPLGISPIEWETTPRGITLGCAGLQLTTEELSRFGQLLLQEGMWEGKPLLPREWIREATRSQIANGDGTGDWGVGYGYQFWMCTHGAYRADGAYGQFCIVIPEQEAVIAVNSKEEQLKEILDAVWDEVYPFL